MSRPGRLIGVGLGPGDPELMTLKAVKALQAAPVVAYFAKAGQKGRARKTADGFILPHQKEAPLVYPMTTEIAFDDPRYRCALSAFYAEAAERLAGYLGEGEDVALLCEGDPLFFGSFMHVFVRLEQRFRTGIVPGVAAMSGAWSAAALPMTWGDDALIVLAGTLPRELLVEKLKAADAAVVMKIGRNLERVRSALKEAGMHERAVYVEYATMSGQRVQRLAERDDAAAPYFSLILAPGQGRRP